ncbi:ChaN family lipoprotein [Chryseobacterium sp. RP-3-3]|uniref:ChaN family lipoprotein n=2 Tax=Chryseobacterium antibioticum TaxID=2728847 RepID=A0A7Y0ANS2_9FLAO|nr:ChaN family lipoprotein [Chryseobacterium antibioticum]
MIKMKHTLTAFLLLLTSFCFSQSKTEIYVIGNIHDSVPNYHPKILFDILDKVKPDITLHEVDSQGMKEYENGIKITENEIKASNAYLKKHPKTLRFPFDFEGRNQYRKDRGMVPTDNLSVKLLDSLYKAKKLSHSEVKIYENFSNLTKELMKIAELSPENFNNATTDQISGKRQNAQYSELLKIIEARPEFAKRFVVKPNGEKISYRDGFKLMSGFWDLRNQTMAKNIYKIAETHPGKKIVVLTGFLHRYYILKELKRINNGTYVIKEFYD